MCYITNTLVTHDTKMHEWHDNEPIYQQLRTTVLHRILAGTLAEGEAVPSVRQVATSERINPLTVSRAYQLLVDEGLLEKRRGLGLFVTTGASDKARTTEREAFLTIEWPRIRERMNALGIDPVSLLRVKMESKDA